VFEKSRLRDQWNPFCIDTQRPKWGEWLFAGFWTAVASMGVGLLASHIYEIDWEQISIQVCTLVGAGWEKSKELMDVLHERLHVQIEKLIEYENGLRGWDVHETEV